MPRQCDYMYLFNASLQCVDRYDHSHHTMLYIVPRFGSPFYGLNTITASLHTRCDEATISYLPSVPCGVHMPVNCTVNLPSTSVGLHVQYRVVILHLIYLTQVLLPSIHALTKLLFYVPLKVSSGVIAFRFTEARQTRGALLMSDISKSAINVCAYSRHLFRIPLDIVSYK